MILQILYENSQQKAVLQKFYFSQAAFYNIFGFIVQVILDQQ